MSTWFARNKHRYPDNWSYLATAVKDRAAWTCEGCGAPHGPSPHILTGHHLNHEPGDCGESNLLTCCQRCHLRLGLRIYAKADAIRYLRERHAADQYQLVLL